MKLFVCLIVLSVLPATAARAQDRVQVPLKVEITIARYQGQKLISSMPYSFTVTANNANRTSLRMGAEVPITSTAFVPKSDTKPAENLMSYSYRSIGTSIDCTATTNVDGRYTLLLTLEETAVYGEGQSPQSGVARSDRPASFRSFRSTNVVMLKDGESSEYTTATDRVTAEVVKVNVKLTVLK